MAHNDDIPTLSLDNMQAAITEAVKAQFPAFKTVEFDRDDEDENFPSPACLMEFIEAEPAPTNDGGSGQWPAHARFDARILLPSRKTAKAEVKKAAIAFATWINLKRFPGIYADPCQVITCEPDEFSPQVERFRMWRVEEMIAGLEKRSRGGDRTEVEALGGMMSSACPICKKVNWTAEVLWIDTGTMGWKSMGERSFERLEAG